MEQALVTLTEVEVHKAGAGDDSGWLTVVEGPVTFDLVKLVDVQEFLASAVVEAGKYTQIRMSAAKVEIKLAGEEGLVEAKVPGGRIKVVRGFTVEPGETTVLLLDFDGDKSLVKTGPRGYNFKPVIKLIVPKEGGRPTGETVEDEPDPTEIPEPTETPEPTATAVPTAVPTATATATPTPTQTPVPDPVEGDFFLHILSPLPEADEEEAFLTTSSVEIVGRTRIDAAVTVEDAFLEVDEEGIFRITVQLEEGPNLFEVVASVDTGEEESTILIISYEPQQ